MENGYKSAVSVKKSRYGPKKVFLSRLSIDSDSSSSSLTGSRGNQPKRQSLDGQLSGGQNQSSRQHNEDRFNQSVKNHLTNENSPLRTSNQSVKRKLEDNKLLVESDKKFSETNQSNSQILERHSSTPRFQLFNGNEQCNSGQTSLSHSQSTKCLSNDGQSKSSVDITAASITQRGMSSSMSSMSLPDELRLSFSEIEEGSLQLDDLDLTCSPSAAGSSSGNLAVMDQEKCLEQDRDLQRITAAISSTSEQHTSGKEITEMAKLSEEFMTNQGQSSAKHQNDVVKSENCDSADLTWDDIVTWGVSAHQVSSTVVGNGEIQAKKKTVPQRRSGKNRHMENVSCQVCGDVAAGFYCGAFICEACKKFYMRAYKQDKLKYVCLRDKKCVITKESRVQCQYCRFQKCVSLKMYIPKQGEGETSKDMQMSEIPCRVCSAPSSGFHFGAITCEGCKGFFRRMAKEREPEKYQCNKKGSCEINMVTRNLCKACRYRSCITAGMSVEGSRIGRQPNSVKHAISMELKQVKTDGGPDPYMKIKEEPVDTSPDFLTDNNKSNDFPFWDQDSNSQMDSFNGSSTCDTMVMSAPSSVVPQSTPTTVTWSRSGSDVSADPISSSNEASLPVPNTALMSGGISVNGQLYAGTLPLHTDKQMSIGTPNGKQLPVLQSHTSYEVTDRSPVASLANSLVFTPSPVTQFLSTMPRNDNTPKNLSPGSGNTSPSFRKPEPLDATQLGNMSQGMPQSFQYSPTSTTSPGGSQLVTSQTQHIKIGSSYLTMTEFISKIIEAGKCLQLLNYRVFDTDVSPATSMNVDDIKALFKSKYMDPKAGNHITSKVDMSMFSTRESTWNYMMTNFHHNTYITIRFAKLVPGFKTLSLNDQVKLIQSSIYPIELLNMSKVFDPTTKKYNYFTYTKEEENIMMEQFPMLRVFQEHFLHIGEMVTSLQFTDEEFAILSALLLFPAEINGLENPKAVEQLQNQISAALQAYEESRFPDGLTRFGVLLVRVAELVQCLLQHNLAIGLLLTHNPTIKVPQLFHELIIESIKEGQKL